MVSLVRLIGMCVGCGGQRGCLSDSIVLVWGIERVS